MSSPTKLVLAGLLTTTLLTSACETRPEEDDITQTHNVIALLPLTGPFAGKGPEHLKAIQMGVVHLEEAGGLDKPIRVFVVDAADNSPLAPGESCLPDSSKTVCRLAEKIDDLTIGSTRHVAAIFSSTTGAMKSSAPTALLEKIPYFEISSGSGLDEASLMPEHDRTYSFALRPLCMPEPDVTADLLAVKESTPGWQRIYVMRGSQAHDKMHTRELRTSMTALGQAGRIINATDVEVPDKGPFESHIDAAIAAGADVIYFHLNGDAPNLQFMQAAERRGFAGKLVTCGMARRQELLHPTDPGIAPYLSNNNATEGRLFFAMRGPVESPSYNTFKEDFKAFSEFDADTFSPAAYDGIVLIGLGIAAAGTSETTALHQTIPASATGGTKFTYGQLEAALAAAKRGDDIDLDGASGTLDLTFDAVLGNVGVGRYYFDTVVTSTDATKPFQYKPLTTPIDVR